MRLFPAAAAFALALVWAVSTAATAAEPPPKTLATFLDIQTIGFPMVVDGRLANYVFVELRITLTKGRDPAKFSSQEPFLRDDLVRAGSRTPFNRPGDPMHLDEARLIGTALADARARLGADAVKAAVIRSQTPQQQLASPSGARPDPGA